MHLYNLLFGLLYLSLYSRYLENDQKCDNFALNSFPNLIILRLIMISLNADKLLKQQITNQRTTVFFYFLCDYVF